MLRRYPTRTSFKIVGVSLETNEVVSTCGPRRARPSNPPGHGDGVGRRVDVLKGMLRLQVYLEGEFLERGGRPRVSLQRINEFDQAVVARGDGRIADSDLLVALGRDGKDPAL